MSPPATTETQDLEAAPIGEREDFARLPCPDRSRERRDLTALGGVEAEREQLRLKLCRICWYLHDVHPTGAGVAAELTGVQSLLVAWMKAL